MKNSTYDQNLAVTYLSKYVFFLNFSFFSSVLRPYKENKSVKIISVFKNIMQSYEVLLCHALSTLSFYEVM